MRTYILIFFIVLAFNATGQESSELENLVLENKIEKQVNEKSKILEDKINKEISVHREYLEEQNDKFYNRFALWFPIFSGVIALFIAIFLWFTGKTQKEAYETASLKASELAFKKVNEIIIPDAIIDDIQNLTKEATIKINTLRKNLIDEFTKELEDAKDEIAKNKQDVILNALDNAIKNNFKKEFDLMTRINSLEENEKIMSKQLGQLKAKLAYLSSSRLVKTENLSTLTKSVINLMDKMVRLTTPLI